MRKQIPNILLWNFESYSLEKKRYLQELDFIKENTLVDYVAISPRNGVHLQNLQQCHGILKEITEYAHKIGLKIILHLVAHEGFYNAIFTTGNHPAIDQAQIFPIANPQNAQAITRDIELITDENGFAEFYHQAIWGRKKIMPIYSEILKAYSFDKTAEGFYKADSLHDVTSAVRITDARTNAMKFEINLGKENKAKNVFVLLAQYYNHTAVSDEWANFKNLIDSYADIPLDGVQLDEYGYIVLNTNSIFEGKEPPFRGRLYSKGMNSYYKNNLNTDLSRLLFDMRYAPENSDKIRIKAINTYFETLRIFPLEIEKKVYNYAKEIFGENAYVGCHNTFHNDLESDEIWKTACNWWDIPRELGHTDENICYPVRWGIMLACNNPITLDMYYSKNFNLHYDHIIESAPFNCREYHHAFDDFYWGSSFTEPEFLKNINYLDKTIATLNDFQSVYPKMDLLIIFGAAAQNNWYPDYSARNIWDIDGTLHIQEKCEQIWCAGYRCALVPDYAVEDNRITLKGNKIYFGGYEFSHCLFLYPKYAKKETYEFLNNADKNGVKIAVTGKNTVDFNGNPAQLNAPVFDEFNLSILEEIGCNKSAIEGGCIYSDGSFSLVSHSLLNNVPTEFDFELNGRRIHGNHTGLLAFRENEAAFATKDSQLFIDEKKINLNYL